MMVQLGRRMAIFALTLGALTACGDRSSTAVNADAAPRFSLTPVAGVQLTPAAPTLQVGDSLQLVATRQDSTGATVPAVCRYSSDHPSIASVNNITGEVKADSVGSTLVKAGCSGTVALATVTVTPYVAPLGPALSVAITPAAANLVVGDSITLSASGRDSLGRAVPVTCRFSSDRPAVATVNGTTGQVKAVATGSTLVKAGCSGIVGTATVTVLAPGVAPAPVVTQPAPTPTPTPAPSPTPTQPPPTMTQTSSGSWPNDEPAGLTQLAHADGSSKYYFAPLTNLFIGSRWAADSATAVVADPASKFGSVVQKRYFVGDVEGWNGIYALEGAPGFGSSTGYKSFYVRVVAAFAPNWVWDGAQTQKLVYFGSQAHVGSPTQYFLSVAQNRVDFVVQTGDTTVDGDYRYSSSSLGIVAGQYFTIELLVNANSAAGVQDGSAQVFVNGVDISASMTALPAKWPYSGQKGLAGHAYQDSASPAFNGMETFLYYGGNAGTVFNVPTYVDLSELQVSGLAK